MSADEVALGLVDGMKKKQFLIIPGLPSKFVYTVNRLFPRFREWLADRIIRKVKKGT
jgi:short-subunit dehydrogenase